MSEQYVACEAFKLQLSCLYILSSTWREQKELVSYLSNRTEKILLWDFHFP